MYYVIYFLFTVNVQIAEERLEDNWVPPDETVAPEELEDTIRSKEAHTNAVILQSVSPGAKLKSKTTLINY
jgi:peptidyl-prolyl cis-trans isomerase-like 4